MARGEPEHGFERDVPVEAPIVSEDKLVEIRVDVLAAQPMIGAEPPAFRWARQSPQRRADSPARAAAPKNSDWHARRRIKTSRKTRNQPCFGFDPPALDFD